MMACIYGLIDPRDGSLRYVGYTAKDLNMRLNSHWGSRYGAKTHKNHWLQSLSEESNIKPEIIVIEEIDPSRWCEAECFWIEYLKTVGCNLTNTALGGKGQKAGTILSEEHKSKISKSLQGHGAGKPKLYMRGQPAWNRGKTYNSASPTGLTEKGKQRPWQNGIERSVSRRKECWVLDPTGQEHFVCGINQFCKERGLSSSNFASMVRGKLKSCQGWTLRIQMN